MHKNHDKKIKGGASVMKHKTGGRKSSRKKKPNY